MPFSDPVFRTFIREWLIARWAPGTKVIDIGPGAGAYYDLLHDDYAMVGVEIWEPYVHTYDLASKYEQIIAADIRNLGSATFLGSVVIMGDILEHLNVEDAQGVIEKIRKGCNAFVVVVPYLYEQGPEHPNTVRFENPYEVHLQPDLTHELFMERYPGFDLLIKNDRIGVYYWEADS